METEYAPASQKLGWFCEKANSMHRRGAGELHRQHHPWTVELSVRHGGSKLAFYCTARL